MTHLSRILVLVAPICLSACSETSLLRDAQPQIFVQRSAESGIAPGEQIVVALVSYLRQDTEPKDMRPLEAEFEGCVGAGMRRVKSEWMLVPVVEFRKRASMTAADLTQPPGSLLVAFSEPAAAARIAEVDVRYVVLLRVTFSTSDQRTGPEVIGKRWMYRSNIEASILDLKHARVAGSVSSFLVGDQMVGYTMQIIPLPIPLYSTSGDTQARNCAGFGEALARFLMGT